MTDRSIFTVGGTVQAGGGVYIARPADDDLLQHCMSGDFSFVLTARQMGKSSLMVRTSERLNAIGTRTVIIDLTRLGTKLDAAQWYLGLIDEIVEQLDLEVDYKAWWQDHAHLGATQRLSRFLREMVLEKTAAPLVLFIDEIDTTLLLSFADDFFAFIRSCYNARSTDAVFHRLAFVLLGVAKPGDLISDPARTPFNIGTRIELSDFTLVEAMPLADGLGLPPNQAVETLRLVLDWTGGHPYLTQRLCRALMERPGVNWNAQTVAGVVEETFFGEASKQDGNLQFVRDMLTVRAPNMPQVFKVYQDVHAGRPVKDEEQSVIISHLKISGVVRSRDGWLKLRNRIYGRVFDQAWVIQSMPRSRLSTEIVAPIVSLLVFLRSQPRLLALSLAAFSALSLLALYYLSLERPIPGKWVAIPAGSFVMGMDETEAQLAASLCLEGAVEADQSSCPPAEGLLVWSGRQVDATLPTFAILDNEVTNAQYQQCIDGGICQPPNDWSYETLTFNQPATNLNWFQSQEYCEWLGGRLPTEAEWEKAARGPENTTYSWGNSWDATKANLEHLGIGTVQTINGYANSDINGYGIKNLAGNVREWTASAASAIGMEGSFTNEVFIPPNDGVDFPIIVRGGSWINERSAGMASNRGVDSILSRRETLGFRCVCSEGQACQSPWNLVWVWFGN